MLKAIERFWRGEYSLGVTFWIWGYGLSIFSGLTAAIFILVFPVEAMFWASMVFYILVAGVMLIVE